MDDFSPELVQEIDAISSLFSSGGATSVAEAIEKCCDLGWENKHAVVGFLEDLLPLLETCSDESEEALLYAIHHCTPESIPRLVDLLRHKHRSVRLRAAKTLAIVGEDARSAEFALAQLLDDDDPSIVSAACRALGLIHACSENSIRQLDKKCRDDDVTIRSSAIHALAVIVNHAKTTHADSMCRDALISATADDNIEIRRSAYYGLQAISFPRDEKGNWLIRQFSTERDEAVQARIVEAMVRDVENSDYREVIPLLVERLSTRNHELFSSICGLLEHQGTRAKVAVPVLLKMLESGDSVPVAMTLWRISRRADYVIPVLQRQFEQDGELICDICCEMGTAAAPLLPQLLEALSAEDDWDLQWAASDAIGNVAAGNPDVVPSLLAALNHESPLVLAGVARSLALVGAAAVEPLMALAQSDHSTKRNYAIYALGKLGRQAASAEPLLCDIFSTTTEPVLKQVAAVALAHVAGDPAAVPFLMRELTTEAEDTPVVELINALAAIGPAASDSIDLLEHIARELEGTELGEAASNALLKIAL